MSNHTQESLEALPNKGAVEAVAAELGLSTTGTRAKLTRRILSHQASAPSHAAEEVAEPATETVSTGGESEPVVVDVDSTEEEPANEVEEPEVEVERARDESGKFEGNDPDTAINEAYDPPKPGTFSQTALASADRLVGSYLGADAVDAVAKKVHAALAAGHQPCIVPGEGNARFDLKVFEKTLHRHDVSNDVSKSDGIVLNVARWLADKNLYPNG